MKNDKVLIISDSHGDISNIVEVYEKEKPSIVVSAGDYFRDLVELTYIYNDLNYFLVRGNCDNFFKGAQDEEIIEIRGKKIFLTHGHLYGVKESLEFLEFSSNNKGVDIVIFGHTHTPYSNLKNGIYYFNPGALKDGEYGILEIDGNGKYQLEHKKL